MAESQQRPGVLGIPALVSLAVAAAAFASYAATAAVLLSAGARRTNVSTRTVPPRSRVPARAARTSWTTTISGQFSSVRSLRNPGAWSNP